MTQQQKLERILKGLKQDRETVVGTRNEADAELLDQYDSQIAQIEATMGLEIGCEVVLSIPLALAKAAKLDAGAPRVRGAARQASIWRPWPAGGQAPRSD